MEGRKENRGGKETEGREKGWKEERKTPGGETLKGEKVIERETEEGRMNKGRLREERKIGRKGRERKVEGERKEGGARKRRERGIKHKER